MPSIIAARDADAMVPVAKKAKNSGIKVITCDGDVAGPTARQWPPLHQLIIGPGIPGTLSEHSGTTKFRSPHSVGSSSDKKRRSGLTLAAAMICWRQTIITIFTDKRLVPLGRILCLGSSSFW
jgi:hypothetical protein